MGVSPAATTVRLRVDDLRVAFGERVALDQVTFAVPAGGSVALIGPNGSGKTTLLNVVAGLLEPTRGSVEVDRDRVAYVLQRHGHRSWMPLTVGEVLRMGRYRRRGLAGRLGGYDRSIIDRAAERMEVADLLGRQYGELSGGQRQRTLVAQALVQEPQVLLLDEPITGLDLASQQRILDLIAEETAAGVAVVISTHHLDEARHCDEVLLLAGRLVAAGPPDEVLVPDLLEVAYAGRMLGDHHGHAHPTDMLVLDEHGHGHPHGGTAESP